MRLAVRVALVLGALLPVRDGYLVVVPEAGAAGLWAAAGVDVPAEHHLPYWNPDVQPAMVEDAGGSVVAIVDGTFALDADPGAYMFCLARGEHPLRLAGCAAVRLEADDRVRVTFGEGGVQAGVLD